MRSYAHCDHCQRAVTREALYATVLGVSLCDRCALIACRRYVRDISMREHETRMAKMLARAPHRNGVH